MSSPLHRSAARLSCPRCGATGLGSLSADGRGCLSCAGERALATGLPLEFGAASPATGETFDLPDPAVMDVPTRIGPYEIIEELGRGGMGRVYAARQSTLGRIVALKVLARGPGAPPELEIRFLREAQTVARLRHPGIIAIHDSGRDAGCVYFSMDYLEAGDLARRLRERPFAPREAAAFVAKIADALAYAHAERVLHRDIKPSNILLEGDEPRLADFGLAAQLETRGDLTHASGVFGTPHYLAPEALRGGAAALTAASDLYALGTVLYAMLTGRTPFAGASPAELPALVETSEPPAVRLFAPAVPADLETICLKCLDRAPAGRYAGAGALAADLQRFLAGQPILARPISGFGLFLRWCRRRPTIAAVWLLITALAVGSTWSAIRIGRERARAEDALARARQFAAESQTNLREARLSEARAVRHTSLLGRRAMALAAIAAAARTRSGADLRDEAAAALLLPDFRVVAQWDTKLDAPGQLTFAPSGQVAALVVRDANGYVRSPAQLWHWGGAAPFVRIDPPKAWVIGPLRFNADGTRLMARYADQTLRVWRTGEARPYLAIEHRPPPGGAQQTERFNSDYDFSPDGALLALGLPGGGVSLHQVTDGREVARWRGDQVPTLVRYSSDGRHLAMMRLGPHSAREISVLKMPECMPERTLPLDAAPNYFTWSSDSRMLAVSQSDNTVVVFDLRDGREVQKLPTAVRNLWYLAFIGGDQIIAQRGTGTTAHLTNLDLGREEGVLPDIGAGLLFDAGARNEFLTSSTGGIATRWQMDPPVGFRILPPPKVDGYSPGVGNGSLDISPDGRWVASGHVRFALVRDFATGRLTDEYDRGDTPADDYCGVAFTPEGTGLIQVSPYTGVHGFSLTVDGTGARLGPPAALDAPAGFMLAAHSNDRQRLLLMDVAGNRVKVMGWHAGALISLGAWAVPGIYSGAFSPDGESVLLNCSGIGGDASRQRLRVYRVRDGAVVCELPGAVSCDVKWSGDGRTALTSNGTTQSTLWDTATWRPRTVLKGELGGNLTTFDLSPDGEYAAITRDDRIALVSARDGSRLVGWSSPGAAALALAVRFLPDGKTFAVLWVDGRIDVIDPTALRSALKPLGLAW